VHKEIKELAAWAIYATLLLTPPTVVCWAAIMWLWR
jgi:hypothetical protein